ncbi:MAG: hypothetical protein ACXACX_09320 [Candidatus Hodarchaeales archaeon]|jgi:hypothetical protein
MREEEYRAWKGSEIVGKTKEEIEKIYNVSITATHRGLYRSGRIQVDPIEIGTLIIAEGEEKNLKKLSRATLPST